MARRAEETGRAQVDMPQRLLDELRALHATPAGESDVDTEVLRRARLHVRAIRRGELLRRRWSLVGAAAAAMLALFVVLPPRGGERGAIQQMWAGEDVNHDGRVDILDALILARRIE